MTRALRLLIVLACGTACSTTHAGPDRLLSALRARGLTAVYANPIRHSFFSVAGSVYRLDDGEIQVFVYPDEGAALLDAGRIAPSAGSVGTSSIAWIAPPHVFRRSRLIVIYLGSNARIRGELAAELGGQIAGAP